MTNHINEIAIKDNVSCWNFRLKELIKSRKLSQTSFANELNKTYNTSFTQATVSDWLKVGDKRKKKVIGFPIYSNMVLIAKYFNVDVGYLTGETDAETFELENISSYLNLTPEATNAITHISGNDRTCIHWGYESEEYSRILSELFSSTYFTGIMEELHELDRIYAKKDKSQQKMGKFREELGEELFNTAFDFQSVHEDDEGANELTEKEISAIHRLSDLIDDICDNNYEFEEKVACHRFAIQEKMTLLINELYPTT